ncbi:hypothetical protein AB0A63_25785 [Lentzea sp. NPDC042327]|uniref:hypothetical protein n=1 Tax=Lentzea sp. NPDC042327 TaxID=3154801 RepID=UPI0033CD87E1
MPISAALVLTLFGGTVQAAAAPTPVPVLQQAAANDPPPQEVDEEFEFYKMLVTDISEHAEDVEVRDAAKAALAVGTKERLIWFLDHGQAEAQGRADVRKRAELAEHRRKVENWAATGGPNVRAGAQAALTAGDQAIRDFVAYGYEIALKRDKQQAEDDKAEQDRIIARVRDMVAMGGPQVKIEGEAALLSGDYARIRQFYLVDYHEANQRDHDMRAVIQKALEDRNKAITELDQIARRAEAAASARAEILRANIDAVKHLEDVTYAMKRAVEAAHRADRIFRDDKPGRAHGQLGRNDLLDAERANAARESEAADRIALASVEANTRARNAAQRLVDSGMTDGLDWAKVTIGIGNAVDAAALAAETSMHAATATLADSRALDADRNAQEHADNAAKYRAEAERQAAKAAELAEAAKKQQDIAIAARNRAEQQKNIASAKAADAQRHATNARNHRINAQAAARNAAVTANAAYAANAEAARLAGEHDAAVDKVRSIQTQVDVIGRMHNARLISLENMELRLRDREQVARERGENVEEVTREIRGQVDVARGAANETAGWASAAASSAAAARASAQQAAAAAQAARTAANNATREAVTARRAADEAHRITLEAVNVALGAKASAEMTQQEAEAAVREANQAVFQSVVADRAASAAAASAALVVDSARAAELILKPYAALNADARRALQTLSDALLISEEQSRLAREKADEAAQAAVRAAKAADDATADVKPAYEAASRAADSANQAAQYAQVANDAANQAVQHAQAAHGAAGTAGRWSNTAQQDAVAAGNAAAAASASAASADRAAAATEQIYAMARASADKVQEFIQSVVDHIDDVHEYRVRLEMAEQIAREEAQKKADELNGQLIKGILTIDRCLDNPVFYFEDCKRAANKVEEVAKSGLKAYGEAAVESLQTGARCAAGDQAACQLLREGKDKLTLLYKQIGSGIVEGAKGTLDGLLTGLDCVGGSVFGDFHSCKQIWDGLVYTVQNPYTLIHLEEWHDNPAKALGLTLWDLSFGAVSTVASGGAGALTKTLSVMKNVLGKGTGKILDNLAELRGVIVKLDDTVPHRLPGSLGEIFSAKVHIENGVGKIDNAVVAIDGRLYRLESYSSRLEGDLSKLDGADIRIEGGTLRIENGLAKLDDAKFKVEQPKVCAHGLMAAAADCTSPTPDPDAPVYKEPTFVNGDYWHDIGALRVRISAADYQWADAQLKKAADAEKRITPDVDGIADAIGADRKYRIVEPGKKRTELKSAESYLRKLFDEMNDGGVKRDPRDIQHKMNDAVRYTYVFPDATYTNKFYEALVAFEAKGYTLVEVKNFWAKMNGYPGINTTFRSADGQLFELQFHTDKSFKAKSDETTHYEKRRTNDAQVAAIQGRAAAEKRPLTEKEKLKINELEADTAAEKVKSDAIFNEVDIPPSALIIPNFKLLR